VGEGDQPCALDAVSMARNVPPGTLRCRPCQRVYAIALCEVCDVELLDLPARESF
jgi:hypothetical protein